MPLRRKVEPLSAADLSQVEGSTWEVMDGHLVVDGFDLPAERALAALGGEPTVLVALADAIEEAIPCLRLRGEADLAPTVRRAAGWVGRDLFAIHEEDDDLALWLAAALDERLDASVRVNPRRETWGHFPDDMLLLGCLASILWLTLGSPPGYWVIPGSFLALGAGLELATRLFPDPPRLVVGVCSWTRVVRRSWRPG